MKAQEILIVEDEKLIAQAYSDGLANAGFKVIVMESGQSAIDYAEAHHPSLILLDILMPNVNGVEVIKAVRQQSTNKGVPIIVITNLDQSQILTEVQKLDIQGYYIKSNTSLEKLVEIINKIFSPEN